MRLGLGRGISLWGTIGRANPNRLPAPLWGGVGAGVTAVLLRSC